MKKSITVAMYIENEKNGVDIIDNGQRFRNQQRVRLSEKAWIMKRRGRFRKMIVGTQNPDTVSESTRKAMRRNRQGFQSFSFVTVRFYSVLNEKSSQK